MLWRKRWSDQCDRRRRYRCKNVFNRWWLNMANVKYIHRPYSWHLYSKSKRCEYCLSTNSVVSLTAPSQVTASASKMSYGGADLSCASATDGVITFTASGGTGQLQYSINNGIN